MTIYSEFSHLNMLIFHSYVNGWNHHSTTIFLWFLHGFIEETPKKSISNFQDTTSSAATDSSASSSPQPARCWVATTSRVWEPLPGQSPRGTWSGTPGNPWKWMAKSWKIHGKLHHVSGYFQDGPQPVKETPVFFPAVHPIFDLLIIPAWIIQGASSSNPTSWLPLPTVTNGCHTSRSIFNWCSISIPSVIPGMEEAIHIHTETWHAMIIMIIRKESHEYLLVI